MTETTKDDLKQVRGWALRAPKKDRTEIVWLGGAACSRIQGVEFIKAAIRNLPSIDAVYDPEQTAGWILDRVPNESFLIELANMEHATLHDSVLALVIDRTIEET